MPLSTRSYSLLIIAYTTLNAFVGLISAHRIGSTINVQSGHSIQSAINSAKAYDHIIVAKGTYAEQLTITQDGITLIGQNAILVPPKKPTTNKCSGLAGPNPVTKHDTQAGICIIGSNVVLAKYKSEHRKVISVGQRVKAVSVTGFTISGFDGLNIALVGAQDAVVNKNSLTDGATYGALTVGSKNSAITHNIVLSNAPVAPNTYLRYIGICMDDVSSATVAFNSINGYNIALCVQTDGANVHDNQVTNSCIGAFVDPGVNGAQLVGNSITNTNSLCRKTDSGGFAEWGIALVGAKNTLVKGNDISGIKNGLNPKTFPAAGVAVLDDFTGETQDGSSGNKISNNSLKNNDVDLNVNTKGTGNVETGNQCKVGLPAALCK
jgi:hypothetical protein